MFSVFFGGGRQPLSRLPAHLTNASACRKECQPGMTGGLRRNACTQKSRSHEANASVCQTRVKKYPEETMQAVAPTLSVRLKPPPGID